LLVSVEVALALVVLIGAGLLIRDFLERTAVDTGIRADHVLTAEIHLKGASYDSAAATSGYYAQALEKLGAVPAVTAVSAASALPVGHGEVFFMSFAIPGQLHEAGGEDPGLVRLITPGYFDVLGIHLLGGRDFTQADSATAERVAMVNQTFVQRYFRGESPIGKSLLLTSKLSFHTDKLQPGPVRIVAVTPDIKHWCIGCEPHSDAEIYVPFAQAPAKDMIFLLRYERNAEGIASAVRRQLRETDSSQGIKSLESMSEQLSDAVRPFLFYPALLSIFGLSALALACMGVYGVLSYSVAERRHEIGIRMALGATHRDITKIVVGRSGKLVAIGVVAGLISALGLTRFLAHLLHGVSPMDPLTFAAVPALLVLVSTAAAYLPARRAGKIDPIIALRSE
jgi:putative ABC transport system permease protein